MVSTVQVKRSLWRPLQAIVWPPSILPITHHHQSSVFIHHHPSLQLIIIVKHHQSSPITTDLMINHQHHQSELPPTKNYFQLLSLILNHFQSLSFTIAIMITCDVVPTNVGITIQHIPEVMMILIRYFYDQCVSMHLVRMCIKINHKHTYMQTTIIVISTAMKIIFLHDNHKHMWCVCVCVCPRLWIRNMI